MLTAVSRALSLRRLKRRKFITLSAGLASALAVRPRLFAQDGRARAAVVIGVDKAGDLVKLKGAASGASQVANWLAGEGFDTKLLSDATAPVRVNDVYTEVAERINRGTLDQLVIYFAGHGFINHYSEFWMLSGAPDNPNEAVSLRESIELARVSGVPNVAFISDACRSRPDSLGTLRVRGSLIFPNRSGNAGRSADIDVFLATLVGDASFEVPVATSAPQYEGIYTAAFLSAFTNPDDTMVRTIGGVRVVPNNKMKAHLEREVRRRAEQISIQLRQIPDTQVVSGDDRYIGKVTASDPPARVLKSVPPATIQDVAAADLAAVGIRGSRVQPSTAAIEQARRETGYESASSAIREPVDLAGLELRSGLAITGARVEAAWAHPSVGTRRRDREGDADRTSVFKVDLGTAPAASVAVEFADGGGTVVAALADFVANIAVENGRVVNVWYVPTPSNYRADLYADTRRRAANLHASVATAARFGVFRIEGGKNREQSARALADSIRVLKGFDPTLGLYAAYAYAEAGVKDQVRSVRGIMRDDLHADLFDVAMLADGLRGRKVADEGRLFPFCPMLSQGWNLLRVKDVQLSREVAGARDHLLQALWTTLDPQGFQLLSRALRAGRLR
jgi:hypothetical protein